MENFYLSSKSLSHLRQLFRCRSFCEHWFAVFLCSWLSHSEVKVVNVKNEYIKEPNCDNTWKSARILSMPQSGVFMLPSASSESDSLEFWTRCLPWAAFLSLVPNPDSSSPNPDGVRLGRWNSLLGLTSLSSSSEIAEDCFLDCKRAQKVGLKQKAK